MTQTKQFLFITASLSLSFAAQAEDGHFSMPPSSPVAIGHAGSFGSNDRAPEGCDANALLAWMKEWRQKARMGYVNGVVKYIPSISPGVSCIKSPSAFDAQYVKSGDYFMATCLAQKNGTLTHLFRMDIVVTPDQCLNDARFSEYIKGTQCKMPGGNQKFLDEVMKPCAITPANSPILRGPPTAYSVDVTYFNKLLNDRPEIREIVDENTRKVKVGPTGSGGSCSNPFGCDSAPSVDGNSRDVK